jgi:F-type H+-transporting ATPase subunit b
MRTVVRLGLTLLVALAPAAARAAGGDDGHGGGGMAQLWHALNLLVLVGALVYFARGPIAGYLNSRRSQIEAGIQSAGRELADAEERLAACEQRAAALDAELDEIRLVVRQQAEADRDRLLAEATATAARIRRDAVAAAEQEVRRARQELRTETVNLAVQLAGELLRGQVDDADRARLVDDFVQRIEQPAAGRGAAGPPGHEGAGAPARS